MKWIPFDKFVLSTSLSPQETLECLRANVSWRESGFAGSSQSTTKPFWGKVNNFAFKIYRDIQYRRNSFVPVIVGKIIPENGGSRVAITMRMTIFTMIFMGFWLGIVGVIALILVIFQLRALRFAPAALIPELMFLFGYGICLFGFNYERGMAKDILRDILNVQSNPEASRIS